MKTLSHPLRRQAGAGLFALLFWAVVVSFLGLLLIKAAPTVAEYYAIQSTVRKVLAGRPASIPEIRTAFDKQRDIEYGIESVTGRDLEIQQQGDHFDVSFAYDKEIQLIEPVYLLIKYRGGSR